jgi:hypothetical protein
MPPEIIGVLKTQTEEVKAQKPSGGRVRRLISSRKRRSTQLRGVVRTH